MDILLSTKGRDVTVWRAVEEFTASYRQTLLDLAASDRSGSAETVFSEASAAVEAAITTHQTLLKRLDGLIEHVASATPATDLAPLNGIRALTKSVSAKESQKTTSNVLKELTVAFYSDLYCHFGQFRSAPVFYQLSMAFLTQLSATVITQATEQLALPPGHLPEMALMALGTAGRCEYSPFYPFKVLLVHGEATASQLKSIHLICQALHAGFEAAGLSVDPVVTPRNPVWRGTIAEWRLRCEEWQHPQAAEGFTNLCRLVDQYPLHPDDGFARELREISRAALKGNRSAAAHLVEQMVSLSNGLGIMGRLKLERSGSVRGLFRLMEFGVLPLSAALSALALIKESQAVSTCDRINDLMRRQALDVELAERMLATWYSLHDLRLRREQSFRIDEHSIHAAFLDPDQLTAEERQSLKKNLESVAHIQRNVEIIFSGMGE